MIFVWSALAGLVVAAVLHFVFPPHTLKCLPHARPLVQVECRR
jgi:hypothetical protein